jgi:hypothetical protein
MDRQDVGKHGEANRSEGKSRIAVVPSARLTGQLSLPLRATGSRGRCELLHLTRDRIAADLDDVAS